MQSAKTILQIYRSNVTDFLYKKHSKKKERLERFVVLKNICLSSQILKL
jgi:hypothetical protein